MKKAFGILFVLALIIWGCKGDIIVEPPSSLRGAYEGTYIRIKQYSSAQITDEQQIDWTFSDQKFWCSHADSLNWFVCEFSGTYELTDKVVLKDGDLLNQLLLEATYFLVFGKWLKTS